MRIRGHGQHGVIDAKADLAPLGRVFLAGVGR